MLRGSDPKTGPQIQAHCKDQHKTDVYLSKRCEFIQDWMAKPFGLTIKSRNGGAYRDRTDDPLLAKQVLSQLS